MKKRVSVLSGFDPSIRVRKELEAFFGVGLSSANPFSAVSELIDVSGAQAKIGGCVLPASSEILLISTGKASEPMAKAVEKKLGSQIVGGIVVMRNRDDTIVFDNLETIESSHPVPDARSEKAAKTVMNALDGFQVNADHPDRRVVYCVSGGTSSLMACPMHGLSMADIQETTQSLLGAGATIHEINTVRKHITDFSGGKLAGHFNGEIDVLVLSDVMGDDLDVIASGPCVADRSTYQDAVAVIAKFELEADIPKPVMDVLDRGCSGNIEETAKPGAVRFSAVETYLVGSNRRSLDAIVEDAQSKGLASRIIDDRLEREAVTTGQHIVEISLEIQKTLLAPMLLVFGGETTVTLCDAPGFGGRCQEMALSAAIHLSGQLGITLLAAGTDGSDGPDGPDGAAAGAIVDGRTVGENDVEARQALRENNAYEFLNKRVALVKTGPTGTNVNDIVLVLVEPR